MLGISPVSSGSTPNITPMRSRPDVNNAPTSAQPRLNLASASQNHTIFNLVMDHSVALLDALEAPKPDFWEQWMQWLTSLLTGSEEPPTDEPQDTQYFLLSYLGRSRDNPLPNQPSTDFKFDPNVPNHKGEYLLMRAAKSGRHPNAIRKLIAAGANLNIQDKNGRTPLMHTILSGDVESAIYLIEAGARLDIVDNKKRTTLHYTSMNNTNPNLKIAKAILKKHKENRPSDATERIRYNIALYQQADQYERIPLTYALINRSRLIAEKLVKQSGNWNKPDEDGYTPLMYAAKDEHNEALVAGLIRYGADCQARDKQGRTALMHAASIGSDYSVNILSGMGAEHVTAQDNEGKTALMHLMAHHNGPQTRKMIWKLCLEGMGNGGAGVLPALLNQRDLSGKTAMMHAAEHGNIEAIRELREIGTSTDLDLIDQDGNTALIHAVQNSQPEVVFELCKLGANPNIKNQAGKSAYQVAEEMGHGKVLQELQVVRHQKTENGLPIVIEDYPEDETFPTPPVSPAPNPFNNALPILGLID